MQASFEMRRFPVTLVAIVFGIAVALLLGLGIGYTLKPTSVITGPATVVAAGADSSSAQDQCIWVAKHKEC
jgi:hypothetical protein